MLPIVGGDALADRQQLDGAAQRARGDEVGRGDLGDALAINVVGGHPGVEGDGGQDRGFGRGVVAFDVGGGIGLGVAERAGVGQGAVVVGAGAVHLGQDVVGGAVDDAGHPQHRVAGQRLGQRADHRDGAGDCRLEIQVDMRVFGGLRQFSGGGGQQRLVRRDDGLAVLERGQDRLARRLDRAHHFDDDVDVFARDEFFDVVGEQIDRHTAVGGYAAYADAAQHQRRADTSREVVGAVLDDANNFTAHIAQSEYRYADRLCRHAVTAHLTSRLSRSSTVSLRRIRRARPSRTATTAGRPIKL